MAAAATPSGLMKLQDLMRLPTRRPLEVLLRHATSDTYVEILREIKAREIYNLVVGTKAHNMNSFLKGVLSLQMNDYKYHYLFTTFVSSPAILSFRSIVFFSSVANKK